ncbi:MAG: AarF/ABC1/UbiB kinase family protein [Acidobacteriota bacterium]|nr:AarF/ABC1/UbiB kinase family protein [Acidobacteriota bacterium]
MDVTLAPKKLKRYKDIAWLLIKYGRSDLASGLGPDADLAPEDRPAPGALAEELASDLERLGPAYIKLGQILSTRGDFLPPAYVQALARLQDRVEPFPFGEVERILAEELGVRISKAFAEFEAEPLAAASLGQVHRARLRDGREVAVKVQRPNIREAIADDLEAFAEVGRFLDRHSEFAEVFEFEKMVEEFKKTLIQELDYRKEAANLVTLGANLAEFPAIFVPQPVPDFTTERVLTMEFVTGKKVTALGPVERIDLNGTELAEQLLRAYLKQILIDGFFHADPHPGNVFITNDHRIALLDLGMVARISPSLQEKMLKLVLAVSEGNSDRVAELAVEIGRKKENFEPEGLHRQVTDLVGAYQNASLGELRVGRTLLEVARASAESGLKLPSELTILAKTLLQLDEVGRTLDPTFEPNAAIRRDTADLLKKRMLRSASPGRMAEALLEAKEFAEKLPGRVNRVLDLVANNELKLEVDAIDETVLIGGLQKTANRIALGLVLAALIVGAALLMQVPTTFRILGYPGLAILFFLAATAGGVALIASIIWSDRPQRRRRPGSGGV